MRIGGTPHKGAELISESLPFTRGRAIPIVHWFVWTRPQSNSFAETRLPIPMKAGRPARFDYEYERNGTANLFMMPRSKAGATSRSPIATPR